LKIIFVNGCFDVIHRGHIELFKYAKSLGDLLVVAIDSDRRVKNMKGQTRPINNQSDRKFVLESIKYIDNVKIFENATQLTEIVNHLKPDIMVVGSDYRDKMVIGSQYAKELKFFEKIDGYSTTKTIQDIDNR